MIIILIVNGTPTPTPPVVVVTFLWLFCDYIFISYIVIITILMINCNEPETSAKGFLVLTNQTCRCRSHTTRCSRPSNWNPFFFISNCLVVYLPLWKNMSSSMGRMTSHLWNGKLKPCLKPPTCKERLESLKGPDFFRWWTGTVIGYDYYPYQQQIVRRMSVLGPYNTAKDESNGGWFWTTYLAEVKGWTSLRLWVNTRIDPSS